MLLGLWGWEHTSHLTIYDCHRLSLTLVNGIVFQWSHLKWVLYGVLNNTWSQLLPSAFYNKNLFDFITTPCRVPSVYPFSDLLKDVHNFLAMKGVWGWCQPSHIVAKCSSLHESINLMVQWHKGDACTRVQHQQNSKTEWDRNNFTTPALIKLLFRKTKTIGDSVFKI